MSVADQDPPSVPVGVQGQQLVQWLSVQADHVARSLQQNARALMVRASSPMPSSERHKDEVARLQAQLHHAMRTNHDMRAMLQNQALAIPDGKWLDKKHTLLLLELGQSLKTL